MSQFRKNDVQKAHFSDQYEDFFVVYDFIFFPYRYCAEKSKSVKKFTDAPRVLEI